jgi:uncharacterized protein HemY
MLTVAQVLIALVENTSFFAPPDEEDIFEYQENLCKEALALCRACGYQEGVADSLRLLARCMPPDEATRLLEQSLVMMRRAGDTARVIKCLERLGHTAFIRNDPVSARDLKSEALALARESRDQSLVAHVLFSIAMTESGDTHDRVALFEEAAQLYERMGRRRKHATCLAYCAMLACRSSDAEKAQKYLHTAISQCALTGDNVLASSCYDSLAELARERGEEALAADYEASSFECFPVKFNRQTLPDHAEKPTLEILRSIMIEARKGSTKR